MNVQLPIDTAFLKAQTFGDDQLEAELLVLFIAQAGELRPKLLDVAATTSAAEWRGALHTIKGSARAIGALPLAAAAEAAEHLHATAEFEAERPAPEALKSLQTALDAASAFAASLLPANHRAGLAKRPESR